MSEEIFTKEHFKVCRRGLSKGKPARPCKKRYCGKNLYRFLKKYNKPLDINYHHNL